jgi:hypothetical protein
MIDAPQNSPAAAPGAPSKEFVHASLQQDVANGRMDFIQANEFSIRDGFGELPKPTVVADPVAAYQAERAKPAVRLQELKSDSAFVQRLMSGDRAARAEWDAVHIALATGQSLPLQGGAPSAAAPAAPPAPAAAGDMGLPAGKLTDFELGQHFKNEKGEVDDRGHAAHVEVATWMAAAHLPGSVGTEIGRVAADFAPQWQEMTQEDRNNYAAATRTDLTRLWGPSATDKLGMARLLVAELGAKHKGVVDFLERSGAGSHSGVIVQLAHQAERLAARKGLTVEAIKAKYPKFFEPME